LKPYPPLCQNQAILTETEIVLDGRVSELRRISAEVAKFCREHSLSEDVEFDLNLVLEELFMNSVNHGGCEGMENAAQVRLQLLSGEIVAEYADRGRAFDPFSAPEPDVDAPLNERPAGGLGVHLVRQTMRDWNYRRDGEWNRTTMRRNL